MESDPNYLRDPYKPDDSDDGEPPDLECAICFCQFNNIFNTPKVLECKHTFCLECLARMNVKSTQPNTIQCPLCRAYTPLPDLGLPKLANDSTVLSYLPAAMQHVYSIRFNRSKGKLQVKRVPSSAPAQTVSQSLDVGNPAGDGGEHSSAGERSVLITILRTPLCKAFIMSSVAIITVILIIVIIFIISNKKST
ncbi:RING finger protein 223 [Pseudorasbora parva]|uniref:RING finger protein 223 n=1 Tax=Pseudorasbora parva TaxID=51549 RepID=UPI00351ECFC8